MILHDRNRSVQLLGKHDSGKAVRKRHPREREQHVCRLLEATRQAIGSADDKRHVATRAQRANSGTQE